MSTPEKISPDAVAAVIAADTPKPTAPAADQAVTPPAVTPPSPAPAPAPAAPTSGETDAGGVPFDPAKHTGKKHPKTGRWMPRGGRKPGHKSADPAPAGAAWSDAERAAATAPATPANAELIDDGHPAPAPGAPPVAKAKDAAEVACRSIYAVVGAVTKSGAEAKADPEDHENLRDTAAAYIESKGWTFVGLFAVGIALLAYFLRIGERPKVSAWAKDFFSRKDEPAPAEESASRPASSGAAPGAIVSEAGRIIPPLA